MGIHYMDATTVEECWRLLRQTGKSNSYESLANLPRYTEWLKGQDWTDAYARHKQNLQLVGLNDPEKRWVLKNPSHMTALDALMAVYPDALIVYTHREPVTCIASSCSLSAETTVGHSDTYVGGVIGHTQLDLWSRSFHAFHDARPDVRPGAVRRRRLQGPARRPDRHRPARIYEQFGARLDARGAGRDRGDRPRVQAGLGRSRPTRYDARGLRPHRRPGRATPSTRVGRPGVLGRGLRRPRRRSTLPRMTPERIGVCQPASRRRRTSPASWRRPATELRGRRVRPPTAASSSRPAPRPVPPGAFRPEAWR